MWWQFCFEIFGVAKAMKLVSSEVLLMQERWITSAHLHCSSPNNGGHESDKVVCCYLQTVLQETRNGLQQFFLSWSGVLSGYVIEQMKAEDRKSVV